MTTSLLDGWFIHQAALDAGRQAKWHRLRVLPLFPEYVKTLCGQVWLKDQAVPSGPLQNPCRSCERAQHGYEGK